MWVSQKRLNALEEKISDLENRIQGQKDVLIKHLDDHGKENGELKQIFNDLKRELTRE